MSVEAFADVRVGDGFAARRHDGALFCSQVRGLHATGNKLFIYVGTHSLDADDFESVEITARPEQKKPSFGDWLDRFLGLK